LSKRTEADRMPGLRQIAISLLFLFPLIVSRSFGQHDTLSNRREVLIHNRDTIFWLSDRIVIPHSVTLEPLGHELVLPDSSFFISRHKFHWQDPGITGHPDSIVFEISFRVFPPILTEAYSRLDSQVLVREEDRLMVPIEGSDPARGRFFATDRGIHYEGSFTRGLSVGNRQDLVLNSNFDLRLTGTLGEDIEITGVLSDNSIPLQPEGNTQQLQEFDKVFIQLKRGNGILTGGDFEMTRPKGHFMNYFKKVQGAGISNEVNINRKGLLRTSAGLAVSKGKFARINLEIREGNQGPYRLRGVEGERFIIVLAGSERIWWDGQLLVRGQERDYTIDYNSGEITFTSNRIITKDSRIIAEYEYSDQNYPRSLFTLNTEYDSDRWMFHFNLYSEQDSRNTSGFLDLTTEDKQILQEAGDSEDLSFSSSVRLREGGFDPNLVMYKLIDTLDYSDVLVRSTDPNIALYTAKFSLVGQGEGDYIRINAESNGEVFAWISPDPATGISRGNFAPVNQLIAPKQEQMYTAGVGYRISENGLIQTEIAFSQFDKNRFSDKDKADDGGIAWTSSIRNTFELGKGWQLESNGTFEILSRDFNILKPYRNPEFTRDWNIEQSGQFREQVYKGGLKIKKDQIGSLSYYFDRLNQSGIYTGNRHATDWNFGVKGLLVTGKMDWLTTQDNNRDSRFSRPNLLVSQSLGEESPWTLGIYWEKEQNTFRSGSSDTLLRNSFYYDLGRIFLQKTQGERLTLEWQVQKRWDYLPRAEDFSLASVADDYIFKTRWNEGRLSALDATITVRNLSLKGSQTESERHYLGKLIHQLNAWNGFIRANTTYELGSGQEPRREFQYLKVDPGKGVYTHIDLNDDGIQQINEFEIAPFSEQAEFIRVTILSDEFVPTQNVLLNESIHLIPSRVLDNNNFIGKFSNQTTMRIQRKTLQSAGVSVWNPFKIAIADTALVSMNAHIRNIVFFNRTNPNYDIQWEWSDLRNRFILTTGFESKRLRKNILRTRMNYSRMLSGMLHITHEEDIQDSEAFDSKDYNISGWEINPELTWQPSGRFRGSVLYAFAHKENKLEGREEKAIIHDLKLEGTWKQTVNASLRAGISFVEIDFNGIRNSTLEYAMLDGLNDGKNWLWEIHYDRQLVNNIRINISYEGRRTGQAEAVHTARAQISAFF
jgi:hypothetical protein